MVLKSHKFVTSDNGSWATAFFPAGVGEVTAANIESPEHLECVRGWFGWCGV